MSLYIRLLKYIRPYMHRLMLAILCTVLAAACNLYLPWIIKDVVDKVLVDIGEHVQRGMIYTLRRYVCAFGEKFEQQKQQLDGVCLFQQGKFLFGKNGLVVIDRVYERDDFRAGVQYYGAYFVEKTIQFRVFAARLQHEPEE